MLSKLLTVALAASLATAQTFTDCDPTKRDDCPSRKAVGSKPVEVDFRKGHNSFFKEADGTKIEYRPDVGAVYSISNEKQAPTVGSNKYILFGQVDVTVRASRGVGVVTSFVLQSDDLDEIDWEWLGGDATQVQTNYFSKGCTETYDRGGYSPVADPINKFHTYTIKWTSEQLDWIIDGNVVRTLKNTGLGGCSGYPQSPMQIKLGTWVAGRKDAPQGTIDWAGGLTNFADAPFEGYYQSIRIVDYMGGKSEATEYKYGDRSGTWQSIKVINGGSDADDKSTTTKPSTKTSTSSSATTLSTSISSTAGTNNSSSTSAPASDATPTPSGTQGGENAAVTGPNTPNQTGAAGRINMNIGSAVVAALFGYLVL
ncbi:glycoside hydrolase [Podospora fimiseda]|uniref:Crh-like protein n=1 Tax=Podospora fimiseda TaxID=252190 RepID=A0AAN7H2N7_9PEZI|nr:glycoside hydrolase [Podospora fimiseda]